MNMRALGFVVFMFVMVLGSASSFAQNSDDDFEARLALAQEMHQIRPLDDNIDLVIEQIAINFPEDRRDQFVARMMGQFDRGVLNRISTNAMAETFTTKELAAMVDYFGSPEGRAITDKMPVYQALIQPEILKLVDKAMMELRTGNPAP
jgi:hypothetical protein